MLLLYSTLGLSLVFLRVRVLQCSELTMSNNVRSEFRALAHVINVSPIGAKLPIVGLVTVQQMLSIAKVLLTLAPLVVTFGLTRLTNSKE